MQSSYPPAVAALAADIAVHGYISTVTAGMESALAGTPTLLLDREGWSVSSLYNLGVGRVVFKDWDDLWKACQEHWQTEQGIPGLGDWSSMMNDFDPFRDGRAAERMGTYLNWILGGFKAKLPRETILADAAERYGLDLTPLPAADRAFIGFNLPSRMTVSARIYDSRGRPVRTIADGTPLSGQSHILVWNGRSDAGRPVDEGMYYCSLTIDGETITRKIMITR